MLRRIFGSKRYEIIGDWKKSHCEKLYSLYAALNIIRMIMPGMMRRAGHVALMGEKRKHTCF
jgi:hypothetical protein